MNGTATGNGEHFEFAISPVKSGEFRLDIKYSGDCHHNVTGAGTWPSAEKAKEVAQTIATKRLAGAQVIWVEAGGPGPDDRS